MGLFLGLRKAPSPKFKGEKQYFPCSWGLEFETWFLGLFLETWVFGF